MPPPCDMHHPTTRNKVKNERLQKPKRFCWLPVGLTFFLDFYLVENLFFDQKEKMQYNNYVSMKVMRVQVQILEEVPALSSRKGYQYRYK
jgi:hypothetical protein